MEVNMHWIKFDKDEVLETHDQDLGIYRNWRMVLYCPNGGYLGGAIVTDNEAYIYDSECLDDSNWYHDKELHLKACKDKIDKLTNKRNSCPCPDSKMFGQQLSLF